MRRRLSLGVRRRNMTWSQADKELLDRIGEVLYYLWDPIGVSQIPAARNEYDSYRDGVFSVLARAGGEHEVVEYLEQEALPNMGLSNSGAPSQLAARVIIEWGVRLRAPSNVA